MVNKVENIRSTMNGGDIALQLEDENFYVVKIWKEKVIVPFDLKYLC